MAATECGGSANVEKKIIIHMLPRVLLLPHPRRLLQSLDPSPAQVIRLAHLPLDSLSVGMRLVRSLHVGVAPLRRVAYSDIYLFGFNWMSRQRVVNKQYGE